MPDRTLPDRTPDRPVPDRTPDRPVPDRVAPPATATPAPSPTVQNIAATLRLAGWGSFWVQLIIAVISGIFLFFAVVSRNIDAEADSFGTGLGIFFAICGVIALGFTLFLSFRYTRFGKRLRNPNPALHPQKSDTIQVIRISLIAGLIGLAVSLLGAEVSAGMLLAKITAQPQGGAAVYSTEKFIRVLDILVVLSNTSLAIAHLASNSISFWLLKRLT